MRLCHYPHFRHSRHPAPSSGRSSEPTHLPYLPSPHGTIAKRKAPKTVPVSARSTARLEATNLPDQQLQGSPASGHSNALDDTRPEVRKRRKTSHESSTEPGNGVRAAGPSSAPSGSGPTTLVASPSMSSHLFADASLSLFNSMDVDGGDGSGSTANAGTGSGANNNEDWTQHESIFNSPQLGAGAPTPVASSSVLAPPGPAHGASVGSGAHPTTTPPTGGPYSAFGQPSASTPSPNAQGRVVSPRPLSTFAHPSSHRDSMAHSVVGAPSSATGAAHTAPTTRSKEREQLMSGPLMFR